MSARSSRSRSQPSSEPTDKGPQILTEPEALITHILSAGFHCLAQVARFIELCGCAADGSAHSPHLAALLPAALRSLIQPEQRAAVLAISLMFPRCSEEERESIAAAGFVRPATRWLPSFSSLWRLQVLTAACRLARRPQLPPLLAAVQCQSCLRIITSRPWR